MNRYAARAGLELGGWLFFGSTLQVHGTSVRVASRRFRVRRLQLVRYVRGTVAEDDHPFPRVGSPFFVVARATLSVRATSPIIV